MISKRTPGIRAMRLMVIVAGLAFAAPSRADDVAQRRADAAGYKVKSLEMTRVHAVAGEMTSGWRLELTSARGSGCIVRIDPPHARSYYSGEGNFRGWSQERLASMYESIAVQPGTDDPHPTQLQLG